MKKGLIISGIALLLVTIIFLPTLIEIILFSNSNFYIDTDKQHSYFSFWGSYLGALGTILLGTIAVWQSKRYKELSEKSFRESEKTQQELRDLTSKTSEAVKILMDIEKAKYHPIFERTYQVTFGFNEENYIKDIEEEDYIISRNYFNIPLNDVYKMPLPKLHSNYSTHMIFLRNVSEKTIVNFICKETKVHSKETNEIFSENHIACDIKSRQIVGIALCGLTDIVNDDDYEIEMLFCMENVLSESYEMRCTINIGGIGQENWYHDIVFEQPKKIRTFEETIINKHNIV